VPCRVEAAVHVIGAFGTLSVPKAPFSRHRGARLKIKKSLVLILCGHL
jgi:hypothetical protein